MARRVEIAGGERRISCWVDTKLVGYFDECWECRARYGAKAHCKYAGAGGGGGSVCSTRETLANYPMGLAFEVLAAEEVPRDVAEALLARAPQGTAEALIGEGTEPDAVTLTDRGRQAIAESLARHIAEVAPTYGTARAIRDRVLAKSRRGEQLTRLYEANNAAMNEAFGADPDLADAFRETWVRVHPFALDLVKAADGKQ